MPISISSEVLGTLSVTIAETTGTLSVSVLATAPAVLSVELGTPGPAATVTVGSITVLPFTTATAGGVLLLSGTTFTRVDLAAAPQLIIEGDDVAGGRIALRAHGDAVDQIRGLGVPDLGQPAVSGDRYEALEQRTNVQGTAARTSTTSSTSSSTTT